MSKEKSETTKKDSDEEVLVREEETNSSSDEDVNNNESDTITVSPIKLLLMRTPWFIIGLVVLITGVILSQHRIHLPYEAECDDINSDNFTNSTTPDPVTNHTISY